jgi:hypothetical protein
MLNPSTADAELDDPTIRRCAGFSLAAGYSGIVVGNLFAWRATKPIELTKASDPIGPENDFHLADIVSAAPVVVCAWGARGNLYGRNEQVGRIIRAAGKVPHCLRVTKDGHPAHPLYLPAILKPIPLG